MHQGDGHYAVCSIRCFSLLGGAAMNVYQVEIQVNKGTQAVCLFTRVHADSAVEAKIRGKRFANSLGYFGTMTYRVFDGEPVVEDSEFVF
jgi:hypothetical protein